VAVGVGRVARSPVVARVEGQEAGSRAGQLGGHSHPVGIDGEVNQGSPGQGHVGRVPVISVLGDGVLDVLVGELVLELGGSGGDAVDQQGQVDGLGGGGLVGQLAGDTDPVGLVELLQLGGEPVGRLEEGQADGHAEVDDPMAQHVDGPPVVDLGGQPLGKPPLGSVGVVGVAGQQRLPLLNLGGPDEGEQLRCVQSEDRIEMGGDGLEPATGQQGSLDRILEPPLIHFHAAISSSPVTAAVMRACRRS